MLIDFFLVTFIITFLCKQTLAFVNQNCSISDVETNKQLQIDLTAGMEFRKLLMIEYIINIVV